MAIIQPDPGLQIRLEGDEIGIAVSIDVQGEHVKRAFTGTQTKRLMFARQPEMNEGGAFEERDATAIGVAVTIEVGGA